MDRTITLDLYLGRHIFNDYLKKKTHTHIGERGEIFIFKRKYKGRNCILQHMCT